MTPSRTTNRFEPSGRERELARSGQIKALTLELRNLRPRRLETPRVDARERTLEQRRRQLAAVAKRAATDELGNAA